MTSRSRRRWPGRCVALAAIVAAGLAVAGAVTSDPLLSFDDEAPAEQTGLSVHLPR